MHRRRFVVGAGSTALAGLAGCSGIFAGDDSSEDGNSTDDSSGDGRDPGTSVVQIEVGGAGSPAITGDGGLLAYAWVGGEQIEVEEVDSRNSVYGAVLDGTTTGYTNGGNAFSPDGRYLAVLNADDFGQRLRAYDMETWEYVIVDSWERSPAESFDDWPAGGLAFSPDGEHLAVGRRNGAVLLYSVGEWERVSTVDGADGRSYDQAYGTEFFAHTNDAGLHVYGYPDYELLQRFEGNADHGVAISPDDRFLACNQPREGASGELSAEDWVVTVVETEGWTTVAEIEDVYGTANDIAFLGNEELVLSNVEDAEILGYDVGDTEILGYDVGDTEILRYDVEDWSQTETHTADAESASLRGRSIATTEDTLVVTWDTRSQV